MFRSTPPPALGFADQTTDGGGPTFLPNEFRGPDDAALGAQGIGTPEGRHRLGHLSALQRSSRAQDGSPIHLRMDGWGFDSFDVPDGSNQPKLQFSIFVPTSDFFAWMRSHQASVHLAVRTRCRRTIKASSGSSPPHADRIFRAAAASSCVSAHRAGGREPIHLNVQRSSTLGREAPGGHPPRPVRAPPNREHINGRVAFFTNNARAIWR